MIEIAENWVVYFKADPDFYETSQVIGPKIAGERSLDLYDERQCRDTVAMMNRHSKAHGVFQARKVHIMMEGDIDELE